MEQRFTRETFRGRFRDSQSGFLATAASLDSLHHDGEWSSWGHRNFDDPGDLPMETDANGNSVREVRVDAATFQGLLISKQSLERYDCPTTNCLGLYDSTRHVRYVIEESILFQSLNSK